LLKIYFETPSYFVFQKRSVNDYQITEYNLL